MAEKEKINPSVRELVNSISNRFPGLTADRDGNIVVKGSRPEDFLPDSNISYGVYERVMLGYMVSNYWEPNKVHTIKWPDGKKTDCSFYDTGADRERVMCRIYARLEREIEKVRKLYEKEAARLVAVAEKLGNIYG